MKLFFTTCTFLLTGCRAPLPEKFNEYNFISSGLVSSSNYEVVKLFNTWKGPAIVDGVIHLDTVIYDKKNESVIFDTSVIDFEKRDREFAIEKAPYRILWKMNKKGELIDSIKVNYSLSIHNSGVLYLNDEENYYITWLNNGDGDKKNYTSISDDENLSFQELGVLIKNTNTVDFTVDYSNESTNLHIRDNSGIKLIKSKKLYKNTEGNYGLIKAPIINGIKENYLSRFVEISHTYEKPENRVIEGPTYSLHREFFAKNKKSCTSWFSLSSLGDINSNGRSGCDGIGYFALEHERELIKFKGYAFNGYFDRYLLYHPIENDRSLAIIHLYRRASDLRPYSDVGVYVIRKK